MCALLSIFLIGCENSLRKRLRRIMRTNLLRQKLNAGQPTLGTRVHNVWPAIVEAIGHSGMFDYVEFLAEYAPFDLPALDNFCRAVELFEMSAIIKVEAEPRTFLAQRGVGAGFQGVLFADVRSAADARECVRICRPDSPQDGGNFSVAMRRFTYMGYGGTPEYAETLREIVVMVMIEKQSAVDDLDEILAVPGIDMLQWGPADYSLNIGMPGEAKHPKVRAVERQVIEKALKAGVPPRTEINHPSEAAYYLDLGVRHFNLGVDLSILFEWWRSNGQAMRQIFEKA
ncbi:MAG TPA: 2,4-dihydroxyhept-2-ene-1,7-dioic acid aldolase [Chloroflexi bacterium]|nr:2,4-dihydroxyhept-2-ene-1,7-dioic acid aldolase [Chloroflexota bacterium]